LGALRSRKGGKVFDCGRECWPQAEALVGFLNAYQISGDMRLLEAVRRLWLFIEEKLVDRAWGMGVADQPRWPDQSAIAEN